jgi:hypothetical protein
VCRDHLADVLCPFIPISPQHVVTYNYFTRILLIYLLLLKFYLLLLILLIPILLKYIGLQDKGGPSGYQCSYNVIAAHAATVQKFRELVNGRIGIALDSEWVLPASETSDDQVWFCQPCAGHVEAMKFCSRDKCT